MFNFNRTDAKAGDKPGTKPAPFPYAPAPPTLTNTVQSKPLATANLRSPAPVAATPVPPVPPILSPAPESTARAIGMDTPGSQLIVGPNIKLRGVEISDCDVLIVEGHVEATVNSKAMQIAKPGTLKGVAVIDVAEIDGEFSGELTAHTKLIVRGTGRVSGKIRYGRLIVADGGELSGDVQRIIPAEDAAIKSETVRSGARPQLSPQPLS
ncbi:MAG: polymer-forming cytoskeletal protein [Betaproteobacteria bacterium]